MIYTLPALTAFAALLLSLTLLALVLSVLAGFQFGVAHFRSNLLAGYEQIWPGQPIAAVAGYGLQSSRGLLPCTSTASLPEPMPGLNIAVVPGTNGLSDRRIFCLGHPDDGIFHLVSITLTDERVQRIELYSDVMQRDALYLYWGAPDAITWNEKDSWLDLQWDRRTYAATALVSGRTSVVQRLTLVAKS